MPMYVPAHNLPSCFQRAELYRVIFCFRSCIEIMPVKKKKYYSFSYVKTWYQKWVIRTPSTCRGSSAPPKFTLLFLLLYLRQAPPLVPSVCKLKVILREEIGEGLMVVSFFEIKKPFRNNKKRHLNIHEMKVSYKIQLFLQSKKKQHTKTPQNLRHLKHYHSTLNYLLCLTV